ncbi:MAG: hypothetical protein AAGA80_05450 [Cyanobacteria bacterium P01_F01_bin.143]
MESFLSAVQVAEFVGVSYHTIENWSAQGFLTKDDQGKYGLISALTHKISLLDQELADIKNNPNAELKTQKLAAEVHKEKAIARLKNLEADEKEGKLVDAEQVKQTWDNHNANCKAKLLSIPAKLALELSGIEEPEIIQNRLTEVIDEALIELSSSGS